MPDLSSLLQQHVEQLSHTPSAGFPGVRAKARRRSQQRAGAVTVAALVVVGAVFAGASTFRDNRPGPAHPTPTVSTTAAPSPAANAAPPTLVQTHWRLTSITAFGTTTQLDDEQDYLYVHVPTLGGWLMRVHCQTIAGGVTLAETDSFTIAEKATGSCAAQPLSKAVAEVFRSPVNDHVVGQHLTLSGATGSMSFVAEPSTVPDAPLTSRLWQLTSITNAQATVDLSSFKGSSPDALWLTFGRGSLVGGVACGYLQVLASVPTGSFLDLAGVHRVSGDACAATAVHNEVLAAYQRLVVDGHVAWKVTGSTLEISGGNTVLRFEDKGPASQLLGTPASASAS